MISINVPQKPAPMSPWRKLAVGTWKTAADPSVYGILELNAEKALVYLEKARTLAPATLKITLTHFVGKAVAETIRRHPQINSILRFRKIYQRDQIDIFFQVATDERGDDLSGTRIRQADQKSILQIAEELGTNVHKIRASQDPQFAKMKHLFRFLPGWTAGFFLWFSGWVMYGLNLWSPLFGVPRDPFGSVMITNIGSLGLDVAFAPLVPYNRIPLLIAVTALKDLPVVHEGRVVVQKTLKLCATFDHRLIDGVHAAQMTRTLKNIFSNPEKELPLF